MQEQPRRLAPRAGWLAFQPITTESVWFHEMLSPQPVFRSLTLCPKHFDSEVRGRRHGMCRLIPPGLKHEGFRYSRGPTTYGDRREAR